MFEERTRPFFCTCFTALAGLVILLGACREARIGDAASRTSNEAPFADIAEKSGLSFVHFNGMSGEYYIAEIMGSGCALFDYDNDGDLDVYLVQGAMAGPGKSLADATFPPRNSDPPKDRLFRNDLSRGPDGAIVLAFTDVTERSGIDAFGYGMGVATGDYDNDGWADLYVTNLGPNQLWRNNGDGTFRETTEEAGVAEDRWSVSASFLDFDNDGFLDLYVGNYLDFTFEDHKPCFKNGREYCHPLTYAPETDRLFRNRGDGSFEDISDASGIGLTAGNGLGAISADFNGDSWLDLYVANDGQANFLWLNRGDGSFFETGLLSGCALNERGEPEASMGIDAADFDGDGDEDLFMTHLTGETNTLYLNDGTALFEDRTIGAGLGPASNPFTGFGMAWFDYDNDGLLDLLVVNGAVTTIKSLRAEGDPFPLHQHNQLFRQVGSAEFEEVGDRAGDALAQSEVSRGAAFGDIDNDGDMDVLITNNSGRARLLENRVGNRNRWLGLRLVGPSGRDMLGASVAVVRVGAATLYRRARSDGSYASANDPRILAGLGTRAAVKEIRVTWPGGAVETFPKLAVDRWHTLIQGTGRPASSKP